MGKKLKINEREKEKKLLEQNLNKITETTVESLVRAVDLAVYSFEKGTSVFENILGLFGHLEKIGVPSDAPLDDIVDVKKKAEAILNHFEGVKSFNPKKPKHNLTAEQEQEKILEALGNAYKDAYTPVKNMILAATTSELGLSGLEEKIKNKAAELEESFKKLEDSSNQAQDIIKKMRTAAGEAGFEADGAHYKNTADLYFDRSRTWLMVTGWAAIVTAILIVANLSCCIVFLGALAKLGTPQLITLVIAKLLTIGVPSSVFAVAIKICKSNYHNYIINKSNENSLKTGGTFINSVDGEIRGAIILQILQSVSGHHNSGFVSNESAPAYLPNFFEIIKSLIGTKK